MAAGREGELSQRPRPLALLYPDHYERSVRELLNTTLVRSHLWLFLFWIHPLYAIAAPPATQPAPDLQPLLKGLSADDWLTRERAQTRLEQLDPATRPLLLGIMRQTNDDDLRARLEAGLRTIEDNGKVSPSLVAASFKNVTAREAFSEIAKQANVRIDVSDLERENEPRFSMELTPRPFWQAIRDLCIKTRFQPDIRGEPPQIVVDSLATRWCNRPASVHGPFLVVADRIERDYKVDLAKPDELHHRFTLQLTAYSDPKLLVLKNARDAKLEEAVDEHGHSLLPPEEQEYVPESSDYRGPWEWKLSTKLHHPQSAGHRIARLRGAAQFLVRTSFETWELPQIMTVQNATRVIAGARITIEGLSRSDDGYTLRIRGQGALCGLGSPGITEQFESIRRSIKLLDQNGRAFSVDFAGGSGREDWSYLFTFKPTPAQDATSEPAKLIWDVPTEAKFLIVPFEFKDLPLP
jgi:hypothetical protein